MHIAMRRRRDHHHRCSCWCCCCCRCDRFHSINNKFEQLKLHTKLFYLDRNARTAVVFSLFFYSLVWLIYSAQRFDKDRNQRVKERDRIKLTIISIGWIIFGTCNIEIHTQNSATINVRAIHIFFCFPLFVVLFGAR